MDIISSEDLHFLQQLKNENDKSLLKLQIATSESNLSSMNLKYYLLTLYRKYNLMDEDTIGNDGKITKKGKPNEQEK